MKADMHVHTCHSKRPSQWLLQKVGARESYLSPRDLYDLALERGMHAVTVTDHNTIEGALEIAHLPHTFVSVEVTTYFPEDRCKAHVLVYDIDAPTFADIDGLRENIYDLVAFLNERQIFHAIAHPFYAVNDRMSLERFEQMILLFQVFELNGDQGRPAQEQLQRILAHLTPEDMERLQNIHNYAPLYQRPWEKRLVGGSDDHAGLHTGLLCVTEAPGAQTVEEFLQHLREGRGQVHGACSDPRMTAQKLYSIAYQYYVHQAQWLPFARNSILTRFFDRILLARHSESRGLLGRLEFPWGPIQTVRQRLTGKRTLMDLLRTEAENHIRKDPDLMGLIEKASADPSSDARDCFAFVSQLSNKAIRHFADECFNRFFTGNFLNFFHSIGSAATLYSLLAPYFLTYARYRAEQTLCRQAMQAFAPDPGKLLEEHLKGEKLAFFLDLPRGLEEECGQWIQLFATPEMTGLNATLITCADRDAPEIAFPGARKRFDPVGAYHPPDMQETVLPYPPFLEMVDYCYEQGFTSLFALTPGPAGLVALGLSKILGAPVSAWHCQGLVALLHGADTDSDMDNLIWRYLAWFYDQMDRVHVSSKAGATQIMENGVSQEKIQVIAPHCAHRASDTPAPCGRLPLSCPDGRQA